MRRERGSQGMHGYYGEIGILKLSPVVVMGYVSARGTVVWMDRVLSVDTIRQTKLLSRVYSTWWGKNDESSHGMTQCPAGR